MLTTVIQLFISGVSFSFQKVHAQLKNNRGAKIATGLLLFYPSDFLKFLKIFWPNSVGNACEEIQLLMPMRHHYDIARDW